MARARRIELSTVIGQLPDIQKFNPRVDLPNTPDDLFICALGFEPRCLTLPKLLADNGYRSNRVVFFEYDTNVDENELNRQELEEHLNVISHDVQSLSLNDSSHPNELRRIIRSISEGTLKRDGKITFDLSVAANRIVVTTMVILCEAEAELNILYSEAETYHPTKTEYEVRPWEWQDEAQLGLERGVSDVRPSREVPGEHLDHLPDAIILFPTFKPERSNAVIDFVDPSLIGARGEHIAWLVGIPPLPENQWRIQALKEINGLNSQDVQYDVSTFDYKDTLRTLESVYNGLSDRYKLTLSPIGSKMQALGSSLFSYIHPDARIVFAIPKEYNASQYSEGCRETWKIEFGPLSHIRGLLGSVGRLLIEEQ